jgi:hypothetical protein
MDFDEIGEGATVYLPSRIPERCCTWVMRMRSRVMES